VEAGHTQRFQAMFTPSLMRSDDPDLVAAREAALAVLTTAVLEQRPELGHDEERFALAIAAAWAGVHGFAILWIEGNLDPSLTSRPVREVVSGGFAALYDVLAAR
jgi:hypothetical protein